MGSAAFNKGTALEAHGEGNGISWHLREALLAEHEARGEVHTKFSSFIPLASILANKRYTPPIRYITLTLIGRGSKVLVSRVSIGCHSCYQAACLFAILFSDVIDSWIALTFSVQTYSLLLCLH